MQVNVKTDGGEYPILIERGALDRLVSQINAIKARQFVLIADENVYQLYGRDLLAQLGKAGFTKKASIMLPEGEVAKSFFVLQHTLEQILEAGIDRQTVVLALGGGVAGDHAGFAASILLRGIPFIQIPTTLLAMVDSAVGGKTGINTASGKNLVGSFYQPRAVIADLSVLKTLPEREFLAGYAEVLKYALIGDKDFFDWLEAHKNNVRRKDPAILQEMIARCCQHKADIVAKDEKEGGMRALLNFGHTFGHALEAENGYGPELLHGEAVAIGMAMALRFSVEQGLCAKEDMDAAFDHMSAMGLQTDLSAHPKLHAAGAEKLLSHMRKDKKVKDGKLRLILCRGIGECFIAEDVDEAALRVFITKE